MTNGDRRDDAADAGDDPMADADPMEGLDDYLEEWRDAGDDPDGDTTGEDVEKWRDGAPVVPAPDPALADGGTDDVGPEDARPEGHYPRFRDNTWHYVPDELAGTISLGPGGDGEEGQDWVLSYTPERRDEADREKVFVRLTPRALHELYIETKDLSPDARQAGHTAECDLCGESVPLEKAVPNKREEPVHRRCYVDAYGGPAWLEDY